MGERLPLPILLSEDNLVNQEVALHLLEPMEYRADVTSNDLERSGSHPTDPGTLPRLVKYAAIHHRNTANDRR